MHALLVTSLLAASALAQDPDPFAPPEAEVRVEPGSPGSTGRGGRYAMRFVSVEERRAAQLLGVTALDAIGGGLSWLASAQQDDGSWPAEGDAEVTAALALLAFLADGSTPADGVHAEVVARGIGWLVARQDAETGRIGDATTTHAIATLALLEAFRFTSSEELRGPAELAVTLLAENQRRSAWDDVPRGDGDVVVTSWALAALEVAGEAGLERVDVIEKAQRWLDKNTRDSGAVKRSTDAPGDRNRAIAAALFTRETSGVPAPRKGVDDSMADRLVKRSALPAWPDDGARCDLQYWFWASHALRQLDDRRWAEWQEVQTEVLLDHREEDGAWPAVGTDGECTGRAHSTALALLSLEAPYRFVASGGAGRRATGGAALDDGQRARLLKQEGGKGTEEPVGLALGWLAANQDDDGKWSAAGFLEHGDYGDEAAAGPGQKEHDVGVTGLSVLAFLGAGHSPLQGEHAETIVRGVNWLLAQQDRKSGRLSGARGHSWMYGHTIGTLALVEAYRVSRSPTLREHAQGAVTFLEAGRNKNGVWRYDHPPRGDQDTSVTCWAVNALLAAEQAGLNVDSAGFDAALAWFDAATDPETGRTGYDVKGSPSARVSGINDDFPSEIGEPMTAAALFCRYLLGQDPDDVEIMERQAELLLQKQPEWDAKRFVSDMYYWYYGAYAMYQVGGKSWKAWNVSLKKALVGTQRDDGAYEGSWDPIGPWGPFGGRVYSTAIGALTLEVYTRYERVGGR